MDEAKTWYVYELTDPQDSIYDPIYVGVTTDPTRRIAEHANGNTPSTRDWVVHLRRIGRRPIMRILYETCKRDALRIEGATISSHRELGRNVINVAGWSPARWDAEQIYWSRREKLDARYTRLRNLLDREFSEGRMPSR